MRRALSFAIAIPVSGQAEFVRTALASVRVQSPLTELAVLDASPDDAVQQVLRDAPIALAYAYHHADDGQAAAIQEGWRHTSADVVSWLCADDYLFANALERVAAVFEAQPDIDVVFGHGVHVSARGDFIEYFPATHPRPEAVTSGCTICQPACFVRRRAFERVGGLDLTLQFGMDWDFWLRLHRAGCRFQFLDAPLAAVRVHPATKTLSGGARRRHELHALMRQHGVPMLARTRARTGFWRRDLRQRPGLASAAFLALTDRAVQLEYALGGRTRAVIRGLESWTNRVMGSCEVTVPWYAPDRVRESTLAADRDVHFEATLNGQPVSIERQSNGPSPDVWRYRLSGAADGPTLTWKLTTADDDWRLLGLSVNPIR